MSELPAAARRPGSLGELYRVFNRLALQGFGGVLAVAQRELVERERWLERDEFVEILSVAQVLPGPNIVNLSLMIGDRFFGLRGAFTALAGMMLVPLAIVLVLAALYAQAAQHPVVSGALRGMGAASAGLIIATGLKLATSLRRNAMGLPLCLAIGACSFVMVALLRWPLAWVIAGLGALGIAVAWARLRR